MSDGPQVLVVDDEAQIVRGLKVILRQEGYEVKAAETKAEALDAVSVHPPDAMVLDLVLPAGSGVDVCKEPAPDHRPLGPRRRAREGEGARRRS